tara:strand:+ start:272 stop:409 length:138 start_codon:yes stop_codon:yes gene_type:complete
MSNLCKNKVWAAIDNHERSAKYFFETLEFYKQSQEFFEVRKGKSD